MRCRCLLLLLVIACDKSATPSEPAKHDETAKPADDPWAAKPTGEAKPDPWAKDSSPAVPPSDHDNQPQQVAEPEPVAPDRPSESPTSGGLPAGTYACQQMRYTYNSPPTYVPTGISFELDGNRGYRAPHFDGGPGTVSFEGNVMSFNGGAMNGWHGYTGAISSGPFVRIRMKDPTAIATSLKLGDAMCYLQH